MSESKSNKNRRAFALVELLVAITIFALVITAIYSTFYVGIRAYRRTLNELDNYQEIDLALDRLAVELRNCYASEYNQEENSGGFIGRKDFLSFYTIVDWYSQTRYSRQLARISFSFHDKAIFKSVKRDSEVFSTKEQNEEQQLLTNIDSFEINYLYFETEEKNSFVWKEDWIDRDAVPKGIRVFITKVNPLTKKPLLFQRYIFVAHGKIGEPL